MIDCYVLRSRWRDWPVRAGVKVIEEDQDPIIPLETCRQHLELVAIDGDSDHESHPDDDLILGYLAAALDYCEDHTGLSLIERTLEMALDSFPRGSPWHSAGITLAKPPLIEVISFTGADGSDGELDLGDNYTLDDYRSPAQLLPVGSWPTVTRSPNQVKIRYRVGYRRELAEADSNLDISESDAKPLPKSIRQALLLLLTHFYENRSESVEKAMSSIPLGVGALLGPKSVETGFA